MSFKTLRIPCNITSKPGSSLVTVSLISNVRSLSIRTSVRRFPSVKNKAMLTIICRVRSIAIYFSVFELTL